MELNTNRTDYSALTTIHQILKVWHDNSIQIDSFEGAKWALAMIQHEVEQTGRVIGQF